MKLDPDVEKSTINIPVAEATAGVTPMLKRTGLKTTPPPKPRAPDTHPPIKANRHNLKIARGVNLISLGAIP
jgi:hypothetical protein